MAKATAKKLNELFEQWMDAPQQSEQNLVQMVEAGLPIKVIQRLQERGLQKDEIFSIIINPRTLKHRRSRRQPLSKEESERAVRAVRVLARTEAVFGEQMAALEWLREPKRRFSGRTPMEMLASEPGGRLVEEMLIQIDEGMIA